MNTFNCPQCGSAMTSNDMFCPACGAKSAAYQPAQPQYQAPQYQAPQYQAPQYQAPQYQAPQNQQTPNYGAPNYGTPNYGTPNYGAPSYGAPSYGTPDYGIPMKWHKHLTTWILIVSAIFSFIGGIMQMIGYHYYSASGAAGTGVPLEYITKSVYRMFEGLQVLDILYGLVTIGLGALAILSYIKLKAMSKDGIKFFNLYWLIGIIAQAVYSLFAFIIIGSVASKYNVDVTDVLSIGSVIVGLGISITIYSCNKIYYQKRAHLFH